MEAPACSICVLPKAHLICGLCHKSICKKCSHKLKAGTFSFLATIPEALSHALYCGFCFDDTVAPFLASYQQTMEQAKNVNVFHLGQGEETSLMKRSNKPLKTSACLDRSEALLRLAFQAAGAGFNCLLDVDLKYEKVRTGNYQSAKWSGTGIPTRVDETKLTQLTSY